MCAEETTLNQHLGEFQGAAAGYMPRSEFDLYLMIWLRPVLNWNRAGAEPFQIGTSRLDKFLR